MSVAHSSQNVILISSIHMHHPHTCVLFTLIFSFFLLLFLSSLFPFLFFFLIDKKFMTNLYNSAKEDVYTNDVLSFPKKYDESVRDLQNSTRFVGSSVVHFHRQDHQVSSVDLRLRHLWRRSFFPLSHDRRSHVVTRLKVAVLFLHDTLTSS